MANKKTSAEDAAAPLDGTELVRIVQGGESVRTTTGDIAALAGSDPDPVQHDGADGGFVLVHQTGSAGKPKKIVAVFVDYFNTGPADAIGFDAEFSYLPVFTLNTDPACDANSTALTLPGGMSDALDGIAILEGI
jgi:hypothetical protein